MKKIMVIFSFFGFFISNCFAVERIAECRRLYSELRNIQKAAPSSIEAQNSSSNVFLKARTSKALFFIESAYIFVYESLFNAKNFIETGMESSFKGNLTWATMNQVIWHPDVVNF